MTVKRELLAWTIQRNLKPDLSHEVFNIVLKEGTLAWQELVHLCIAPS